MRITSSFKTIFMIYLLFFSVLAYTQNNNVIDDTAITAKIKAKVLADKSLSLTKLDISTNNGIVMVSGNVESDSEASTLFNIIDSVDGVKDIDASQLTIKGSNHPLTDLLITTKVKSLLVKEKLFGTKDVAALTIHVETTDGVVYLTGTATNRQQAQTATRVARSVSGVRDVVENVKITQ